MPLATDTRAGRDLVRALERADARLVAEEQALLARPETFRRQSRIRELRRTLAELTAELDDRARAFAQRHVPEMWAAGGRAMAAHADARSGFSWTTPHRAGVTQLARDTYGYLLDATTFIRDADKRIIANVVRDEAFQKLLEGRTARQAGTAITRELRARTGLSTITYKNGAQTPLKAYGEMVARTQTALAYNYGEIAQALEEGWTHLEVFDGQGCGWSAHNDGEIANGKVVTVHEAAAFPVSHPNCQRGFAPAPNRGRERLSPDAARERAAAAASSAPGAGARVLETHAGTAFAQGTSTRHAAILARRSALVRTGGA